AQVGRGLHSTVWVFPGRHLNSDSRCPMPVVGVAEVEVRPITKGAQRTIAKQFDPAAEKAGQSAGSKMGATLGGGRTVGAGAPGGAVNRRLGLAPTKGFGRLQAIENAKAKVTGVGHSAKTVEGI